MSLNNLGNKQTIVLHNCEINNEAYDLVITPHKQTKNHPVHNRLYFSDSEATSHSSKQGKKE